MSVPNGLRRHAVPRPADATSITHRVTPSHLAAVGEGPLLTKSTLNAPVPLRRPIDAEGIGTVPPSADARIAWSIDRDAEGE